VLDTTTKYQEMDGFGYTLTGGSALQLQRMTAPARQALLEELFGAGEGELAIRYLRVSIGGSDLDEYPWSYDDLPKGETDAALSHFSMAYDTLYLIPTLKEILAIAPTVKILGSPWSPPAWMKDNSDTRGGSLLKEYYPAYAHYLVKYIEAMRGEGIPIDAITVQNEPLHPGNNPSLLMPAEAQKEFVRDYLGPAFTSAALTTKIIIYDHNADRPDYPISILDDPEAARYIDGSAFHLYAGPIEALSEVHAAHPDKNLYFTEQWIGAPGDFAGDLSWHIENLIIGAPRNWSRNVLQWNLAADENQDPHTDRGGCDRCLGALTITGDSVTRNPAYYIIGHASPFVPPGSVRIGSSVPDGIPNVAFQTPEGKVVVILINKYEAPAVVRLESGGKAISVTLREGDVGTVVWDISRLRSK
jgi:glucosylceramidase